MLQNITEKIFVFHDKSVEVGSGEVLTVSSGVNLVNISIAGTSTDFAVKFYGKIFEDWYSISAINLKSFNLCSTCNSINQLLQIDLTGLTEFKVELDSIENGNITVIGNVVT